MQANVSSVNDNTQKDYVNLKQAKLKKQGIETRWLKPKLIETTWSVTAYKTAMMQGRQQQIATPTRHAIATQIRTNTTSNARNVIESLQCITARINKKSNKWSVKRPLIGKTNKPV